LLKYAKFQTSACKLGRGYAKISLLQCRAFWKASDGVNRRHVRRPPTAAWYPATQNYETRGAKQE
ncbi:MAG: hypothetical protein LUG44_04500, partial [Clostridiales bacterium]|nr:hypothetical protein [Clostridiales bacterium]